MLSAVCYLRKRFCKVSGVLLCFMLHHHCSLIDIKIPFIHNLIDGIIIILHGFERANECTYFKLDLFVMCSFIVVWLDTNNRATKP